MKQSIRLLLTSLIDYAGLFPPASLPLGEAVRNYAAYRDGEQAFALGRFVVPLKLASEVPSGFPLSVLVTREELGSLDARFETIETKATTESDLAAIAGGAKGRTVYVEVNDPSLVEPIRKRGMRVKIRTGGVVQEAFPSASSLARLIRECAFARAPFKATAGLHHPLRCIRPLTYEPNAATGTMHGFVNLFLAAAFVGGAEEILLEEDPAAFSFTDEAASWHGRAISVADLERVRREFAIAFGSCSFEEPMRDLEELGWL